MNTHALNQLDWYKDESGLLPAIVQDYHTGRVLMLGYMNQAALDKTLDTQHVTFFSRSRQRLWTKGEISENVLQLVDIHVDCDNDTLLVTANPAGPACHNGTITCFGDNPLTAAEQLSFLGKLEAVIAQRITDKPEGSYTARIWSQGKTRMAQKVGEEGVEVALAAVTQEDDRLISESADLLYHLALLLKSRNLSLGDAVRELEQRHAAKP
ncbi:MAG: bifunctional phosphoribosyl-AMP cyclohydrolase/phosphoribosyl-ATP diphosphatase HisIE [Steroidobacteraceae bacterium]